MYRLISYLNRDTGGGLDAEERARMESEEAAQQEAEALRQQSPRYWMPYRLSPFSSEEDLSVLRADPFHGLTEVQRSEEKKGSVSPSGSCTSVKCDRSREEQPNFSTEPRPSGSKADLFDGLTEVQRSEEERGSVSPSVSCTSMQSDRSRDEHTNFSTDPRPSGSNTPEERTASDSLINQLREATKALREKTTALEEDRKALREKTTALREDRKALEEKTTALEEDRKALEEKTTALEEDAKALEEKTTALREDRKALEEKTTALEEDRKALEEKTTALEEDAKALEEKTTALREDRKALREKTTALEEDAKALDSLRLKYAHHLKTW
ncbi:caldesmon-like isoform X2 [Centroberyx affinis]|uniref:caldesmon-like isoform X2 n=1 Tax=Centroberyx affinis TaxID=166261 RepID=UPI003A5C18C5